MASSQSKLSVRRGRNPVGRLLSARTLSASVALFSDPSPLNSRSLLRFLPYHQPPFPTCLFRLSLTDQEEIGSSRAVARLLIILLPVYVLFLSYSGRRGSRPIAPPSRIGRGSCWSLPQQEGHLSTMKLLSVTRIAGSCVFSLGEERAVILLRHGETAATVIVGGL